MFRTLLISISSYKICVKGNTVSMVLVCITDIGVNLDSIKSHTTGGAGNKYILTRYITLKNPAGWDEYDKYSVNELINMGYDGVILPDPDKTDYLIFDLNAIKK